MILLVQLTSFSPGERHDDGYGNITQHHTESDISVSFEAFVNVTWVQFDPHVLATLPAPWFTMEINRDLRINVVLRSCVPSSPGLWQAADGVSCGDLLLHSWGCSTFCEAFLLLNNWWSTVGRLCRVSHTVNWVERFGLRYVFLQGCLAFNCQGINSHLLAMQQECLLLWWNQSLFSCNKSDGKIEV